MGFFRLLFGNYLLNFIHGCFLFPPFHDSRVLGSFGGEKQRCEQLVWEHQHRFHYTVTTSCILANRSQLGNVVMWFILILLASCRL